MYSLYKLLLYLAVFFAICPAAPAGPVCLECEGLIPLVDTHLQTFSPTYSPTLEPTNTPTLGPTTQEPSPVPTTTPTLCIPSRDKCGGTSSFGVDAAVEVCCEPTETCTRRNARRWRCQ